MNYKSNAKCYLDNEDDDKNVCLLSDSSLTIIKNSKKHSFPIEWVQTIKFVDKIYLIPIIFGSIAASLSALALFEYYLNPWLMLSILFASVMVVYYGIQGGKALVIVTPIKEYDFFLKHISDNLKSFVGYTNSIISGVEPIYYLHLSNAQINTLQENNELTLPSEGIELHTSNIAVNSSEDYFKLIFDKPTFQVKYVTNTNNELIPIIYGVLKMHSIQKIQLAD